MASYIVAASVFIIGSSYLLHFVVEPPGSGTANMDHQTLRVNAQTALEVLLGTPGYPPAWDGDVTGIQRLGLIEKGTTIRIDPDKFDALARGKFATATADGYIDYAEAKTALGISGYEFHLRAYPVTSANESAPYGLEGMEDFQVAYVGDFMKDGPAFNDTSFSIAERWALDALALGFTNQTRTNSSTGDVYRDDSVELRQHLLPVIGPTIQQTVISAGAGTKYDFFRVNATTYDPLADRELGGPAFTSALALSSDGATLGYSKNRELRAIIGEFNVTSNAGTVAWREYVDTDRGNSTYDCGDYGFVEVSFNDGSSWTRLTDTAALRSQDCNTDPLYIHGTTMEGREANFACTCTTALLAFHWIGDNDNNGGYGWVIDDVEVTSGSETRLSETFSAPEYDMIVLGSNVDHGAFTPDDIKNGIRDYVDLYGGRLVVLGGQNNVEWLDRLLDAGTGGTSGGVATPDTTHPLLTLPNQLSYAGYSASGAWTFDPEEASLFSMVMGTSATSQKLSVSRSGAWSHGGSADGAVILTSYKPYEWHYNETRSFLANAAIYGKYHYLFLEMGPEVPQHEAVASVSRSATMNKYRTGDANYTEMAFVLYLWPGASSDQTSAISAVTPTAPRDVSVESSDRRVWVNFTFPVANGTTNITDFEVWRGQSPTTLGAVPVQNITVVTWPPTQLRYSFLDTNVTNGVTHYYAVTAKSPTGRGTPSAVNSSTPFALPDAPSVTATPHPGVVRLSIPNPGNFGTGTILGYRISTATDGGAYSVLAEVGNLTSYDHAPGDTTARRYKVEAINARGYGPASAETGLTAAQATTPIQEPTLTVTRSITPYNLTLSWVAPPDLLGQTLLNWRIWRATAEAGPYSLLWDAPAGNSSHEDRGLTAGNTYYYKLQGITNAGDGSNSTVESASPAGLPDAPSLFSTSNSTAGTISLSWAAPTDLRGGLLSGYKIWSSTNNADWTLLYTGNALNVSYADAGLGVNATRYYRVQSVTEFGDGPFVTSSAVKTRGTPHTPVNVQATDVLTTTVTWTAPYADGGALTYDIQVSNDGVSFTDAATGWATSPYVHASTNKWFRVRAVTDAGASDWSAADQA